MLNVFLADEAQTLALGQALAASVTQGVVYLSGDLGAGKTTLVRGWLQALGHAGGVKSPTYTLVEPYQIAGRQVYHFDLYRLSEPEELEMLGLRDYLHPEALCLFEWPSRGAGILPAADLRVQLETEQTGRRLQLHGTQDTLLDNLQNNLKKYLYL